MKISNVIEEAMSKGKVLFIVANNEFEDTEYEIPRQMLLDAGYGVITASKNGGRSEGKHKKILLDNLLSIKDALKGKDFKGVVIIGGPGAQEYWKDSYIHTLLKIFNKRKKVIGAICISPVTIARSGILRNKKATVFPDTRDKMAGYGVNVIDDPVVVDDNIVTANGPEVSREFGSALIKLLDNKE